MDRKIAFLVLFALWLTACTEKPAEEQVIAEIRSLEVKLFEDESFTVSKETLEKLIVKYQTFAENYPEHEKSPHYLFRRADLIRAIGDPVLAARSLERLYHDYPDYEESAEVLYLIGFIYENEVVDENEAKYWYNRFIDAYPSHELVSDVQHSLRYIGRPIEELIREWETREDNQQ